jgi:predicted CXXCH cytochrome family protein
MEVSLAKYLSFAIGLGLAAQVLGQEIDTAIFREESKSYTVLDQIENPKERAAFLAVYEKRDALERKSSAEFFLANYPQSWLLAPVYEIAAKACIDLRNYPQALQFGQNSLNLLPENPLLLVPLAGVWLEQGLLVEAKRAGREALQYLDRFTRPSSIPENVWPNTQRKLKASAYYTIGRAEVLEATSLKGLSQSERLSEAHNHLLLARDLNPDDSEIAYLLGLTARGLGKLVDAAVSLARVYGAGGPLKEKALRQLEGIHGANRSVFPESFETFLRQVASRTTASRSTTPESPPSHSNLLKLDYAGSLACRGCHETEYVAWQQTGMARMFRTYRPENVIADSDWNSGYIEATVPVVRMIRDQGEHYFEIQNDRKRWQRYKVDYTIGSKWQQAYATRSPDGQIHVFPIQYNLLHKEWINYWKIIDPPGSARAKIESFSTLAAATRYDVNCAPCHTSQLRLAKGDRTGMKEAVFVEAGINCEMCHGPSGGHIADMEQGRWSSKKPLDAPVEFSKINSEQYVTICGQCHMQSGIRKPQPHGEVNYSSGGDAFYPRHLNRNFADFSSKAFYKDGRFRETTFIVESFLRSACFTRGKANCGHCHNPHPADAASNPKSLKFSSQSDVMCLQCHQQFSRNVETHTRHAVSSEASRCVSCHMPRIMNSLLFQAGSHQIEKPNAELTLRFGQRESPNACLICHSSKDAVWVQDHLRSWQSLSKKHS